MAQFIFSFVLFVMVIWLGHDWVYAQDDEPRSVVDCLADVPDEWEMLRDVEGTNIWVGYERGGFDVPDDIIRYTIDRFYARATDGHLVGIWIGYAPSTPDVTYWWVFDNMIPFADANGEHWGIHPCGAYAVELAPDEIDHE